MNTCFLDRHLLEHGLDHQVDVARGRRSLVVPRTRSVRSSASASVRRPRLTLRAGSSAPRRRAPCRRSPARDPSARAERPALAHGIAMPPPIVPAPMMPTLLHRDASRSSAARRGSWRPRARRRTRGAAPCSDRDARSARTARARACMPSANGIVTAACARPRCSAAAPRSRASLLGRLLRVLVEDAGLGLRACSTLSLELAHAAERLARDRASANAAAPAARSPSTMRVEQAELLGARGADRLARRDHLERRPHADQARQPLRAARAGQQAELDLGQPALRASARPRGSGSPARSRARRRARCRGSRRRSASGSPRSRSSPPAVRAARAACRTRGCRRRR